MIQLFAFAGGVRELPEGLASVRVGSVTAVVGPVEDDPMRHGLLVEALCDSCDAVLPARFGERFADATALAAAVAPHAGALAERLADVAGCVELAVRIADAPAARSSGSAYMRARLRSLTAAHELHAKLEAVARGAVVSDSRLLHDACYLVERDRISEFAESVEACASDHPELSLVCTGPWAPASFGGAQ